MNGSVSDTHGKAVSTDVSAAVGCLYTKNDNQSAHRSSGEIRYQLLTDNVLVCTPRTQDRAGAAKAYCGRYAPQDQKFGDAILRSFVSGDVLTRS
jgi:hypothetical protein